MVVAYTYPHRNDAASIIADGPAPLVAYTYYDANGNRTSKTLENGTRAACTYDDANQLLGISHSLTVNAQPFTLGLAYTCNSVSRTKIGVFLTSCAKRVAFACASACMWRWSEFADW
ncbi:MAG TPA: RHS repeat domain-containing protein [Chthoniobacterales bacterium]